MHDKKAIMSNYQHLSWFGFSGTAYNTVSLYHKLRFLHINLAGHCKEAFLLHAKVIKEDTNIVQSQNMLIQ